MEGADGGAMPEVEPGVENQPSGELARASGLLEDCAWYVIRTRQHKESFVKQQARELVQDLYLPLMRATVHYRRKSIRKIVSRIEPLFPCYLFARFSFAKSNYQIRYCPGVAGIVCLGTEPCQVAASTVELIKGREVDGFIVVKQAQFQRLERVRITEGPFRGIDALFDRYLTAAERVAVLLDTVSGGTLRAVLSGNSIAPIDGRAGFGSYP